jgi:phosphoglucomutase
MALTVFFRLYLAVLSISVCLSVAACAPPVRCSQIDIGKIGTSHFGSLEVEVISAPQAYATLMKSIFDFDALRQLIARKDFRMVYDSMNGVAGPFVREIFVNQLGAPESAVINCVPKEDFGGCHPDPNLTYAEELVAKMGVDATGAPLPGVDPSTVPDFGAAADGDAVRKHTHTQTTPCVFARSMIFLSVPWMVNTHLLNPHFRLFATSVFFLSSPSRTVTWFSVVSSS